MHVFVSSEMLIERRSVFGVDYEASLSALVLTMRQLIRHMFKDSRGWRFIVVMQRGEMQICYARKKNVKDDVTKKTRLIMIEMERNPPELPARSVFSYLDGDLKLFTYCTMTFNDREKRRERFRGCWLFTKPRPLIYCSRTVVVVVVLLESYAVYFNNSGIFLFKTTLTLRAFFSF